MHWASSEFEEKPTFNQLAIEKRTISDVDIFKNLIALYNLSIINEEKDYYIIDGDEIDLIAFSNYWNYE